MTKKSHSTVGKKTLDPSLKNLKYELLLNTGQIQSSYVWETTGWDGQVLPWWMIVEIQSL